MPIFTWMLILTLHFSEMGGGGDGKFTMEFTSKDLCKSMRRAIWSQLKDMNGDLGECVPIKAK